MAEEEQAQQEPEGGLIGWIRGHGAEVALVFLQLCFLAWSRLHQPLILLDDAYIHFKYALSWGRGDGWVFNVGEHVLGTTSPVWTFLLAMVHTLTGAEVSKVAVALNLACDAGTVLLVVHLLRRAGVGLVMRYAIAFVMQAEPLVMLNSVGGMEMSLFMLVILAALEGLRSERWWLAGGALAIAGFVRPEGAVLWVACAGGVIATRQWKLSGKIFAVAILGALVIALLLYVSYGAVIPHSLHAKRLAPWYLKRGGICHTEFFAALANLVPFNSLSGFQGIWATPSDRFNTTIVSTCQIVLMTLGVRWMWKAGVGAAGLAAGLFVAGYYLFYAITNPSIFPWYYVVYYEAGLFVGGVGAWHAIHASAERLSRKRNSVWMRRGLVTAASLAWLVMATMNATQRGSARVFEGETGTESLSFRLRGANEGDREVDYIRIAERMNHWIDNNRPMSVGCMEIGIFGYYFRGRVLDSYGLVSPQALDVAKPEIEAMLPESCRRHPLNVLMAGKPEFIMAAGFMFPRPPAEFIAVYVPLGVPEKSLKVFVRRDVADEPWGFPQENLREPVERKPKDRLW